MLKLFTTLLVLGLLAAAGGFVFLATWDAPVQEQKVEKVIPNDQFAL